jgi:hypothetical protein
MTREERTYHIGTIAITKHIVAWDHLERSVSQRLETVHPEATVYLNPEYTVSAPEGAPTELFVLQARRAQLLWNKRLARTLGAGVRKRLVKKAEPAARQLGFTGIMLLRGRPVHPKGWPDVRAVRLESSGE